MTIPDTLSDWALWAVGGIGAAVSWLVRKVFTNERQIEVLKTELTHMHSTVEGRHDESIEARRALTSAVDKNNELLIQILRDKT